MKTAISDILFRSVRISDEIPKIINLWNKSLPEFLRTTPELIRSILDQDPNFDSDLCIGAFNLNENLVGFILGKRWLISNNEMAQPIEQEWIRNGTAGISTIFVDKNFRHLGIGSKLMKIIESKLKEQGIHLITIGREPGRHLLPGIPEDLENSLEFFDTLDYGKGQISTAMDIIGDISEYEKIPSNNPKLKEKISMNQELGFEVIGFDKNFELKQKVLQFMKNTFPGRWYWRVKQHMEDVEASPDELQLLIRKSKNNNFTIHGFALAVSQMSISTGPATLIQSKGVQEFGGLGPIGIGKDIRGSRGLGAFLLHDALFNLKNKGVKTVLIDWVGMNLVTRFYGPAGFKPYMNYISVDKELD